VEVKLSIKLKSGQTLPVYVKTSTSASVYTHTDKVYILYKQNTPTTATLTSPAASFSYSDKVTETDLSVGLTDLTFTNDNAMPWINASAASTETVTGTYDKLMYDPGEPRVAKIEFVPAGFSPGTGNFDPSVTNLIEVREIPAVPAVPPSTNPTLPGSARVPAKVVFKMLKISTTSFTGVNQLVDVIVTDAWGVKTKVGTITIIINN
jgi:hypothetical protein